MRSRSSWDPRRGGRLEDAREAPEAEPATLETPESVEKANGNVAEGTEARRRRRATAEAALEVEGPERREGGVEGSGEAFDESLDDLLHPRPDELLEGVSHPHPPVVEDVEEAVGVFREEAEREAQRLLRRQRKHKLASPWRWRPSRFGGPEWQP